jgi:hypothetical protein
MPSVPSPINDNRGNGGHNDATADKPKIPRLAGNKWNVIDALSTSTDAVTSAVNEPTWISIGYIAASFLIAVAITYITRSYWFSEAQQETAPA